jgi:hypothetical protein
MWSIKACSLLLTYFDQFLYWVLQIKILCTDFNKQTKEIFEFIPRSKLSSLNLHEVLFILCWSASLSCNWSIIFKYNFHFKHIYIQWTGIPEFLKFSRGLIHNAHLGKISSFCKIYHFNSNLTVIIKSYYFTSQNCVYFIRKNSQNLRQQLKWALWMRHKCLIHDAHLRKIL